jgi:site-specific DNA-methyltransferase (cytosine-N4-specific)
MNHSIDISYKNYKKQNDIHGTVLYPAVMVGPAQRDILSELIEENQHTKIIDPFHGSGTALYEACTISKNISIVGYDINPLANLITKVKLQGIDTQQISSDIEELTCIIKQNSMVESHTFPNINKWFRADIIQELTKIRLSIMQIKNDKNRLYFWYIMSDIIRKYSNTRSCTYKLYAKKQADIDKINNNLLEIFLKNIRDNYNKFYVNCDNFILKKGDSLKLIKENINEEFDICITSPPYGDNATTVTYGQFSILPLIWIDKNDLELEGWEYDNYSIIDSKSLGGCMDNKEIETDTKDIENLLKEISFPLCKKVNKFFKEYFSFLDEISRITKKYIVMTLGNRIVDGKRIELTDITINRLSKNGFRLVEKISREIFSKRTPKILSYKDGLPINSMNIEYVIIMEK